MASVMRTGLLALLLVPFLAAAVMADVPSTVTALPEVFVVHVAAGDNASQLSAISAVSAAVRYTDGGVKQALVVSDELELPVNVLLLEAWKKMVAGKAVQRVVYVGEVSEETRKTFSAGLGNPPEVVLAGDPVAVSEGLAALAKPGRKAREAMAPLPMPESISDDDLILAANAAAAASISGTVLRYSRGGEAINSEDLAKRIFDGAKSHTLCIVENGQQALPAALAAAHYRGFVAKLPSRLIAGAVRLHERVTGSKEAHSITKLEVLPPRVPGLFEQASADSKAFFKWLAEKGLDKADALETVMLFASHGKKGTIPLTFDRHIIGSPLTPEKPGALVGRLPLKPTENLAVINRSTLQTEFFKVSPATGVAHLSFVAYEGNHDKGGSYGPWRDNFGKAHYINEIIGVPGKNDTGCYPEIKKAGFKIQFNNGWDPSTRPLKDPLENTEAVGFVAQLNKGATLFYSSSHGDDDCFFPFANDTGINADCKYGESTWPCRRGRLTTMGSEMSSSEMNSAFKDLWGCTFVFNACLVANGNSGPVLLRHGAGSVVASYISVSFDGAGWWGVRFCEQVAKGDSIAQAVALAYAECSDIFPAGVRGVDATLRYVTFGDPHVTLALPTAR
jgi:hypothetical protein